ncbi:MAG TPA: YbhB/YbcL family Raf kinase inhibitor-like protein [Candidatus Marinimicrobia bacterium]|nr:YbhB/YbcL family Raf kinase inhibitor-like protein [Candidatus Neomarinimicrobiota bacterium]
MSFELTATAFLNEERIPIQYTCEGKDISPRLEWSGVPEGTKSFTLSCLDPDAPPGTWVHWVVYDIPAGIRNLDENLPKSEELENGTLQGASWGVDSFSRIGYYGPCPPPGHGNHRYYFRLYALSTESLSVPRNATWFQIEKALDGHLLGTAEHMGTYSR